MPLDAENGKEKHRVMPRLKGVFALRTDAYNEMYGPAERAAIPELIDVIALSLSAPPPYSLPNVILTPPDFGSPGSVRCPLRRVMAVDLQCFSAGKPLQSTVAQELVQHLAML